ncbi:MAG: hypothetical protein RL662_2232 [Bacteroidota bacterium]|jgi:hypothetical protein
MINLPLAHLNGYFVLDGQKYKVEQFKISFAQEIDYKGQPQHEVRGGQLMLTLPQAADDNLLLWAKKATLLKDGEILFQTDMGISVLRLHFSNGCCMNMTRDTSAFTGTTTMLMITAESLSINGIEHHNYWGIK